MSHRIEIGARLHNDSIRRLHTQDAFDVEGSRHAERRADRGHRRQ
ncbi:MAG: hypothetical protein R3B70_18290 [Polyangiaceae bacterium]